MHLTISGLLFSLSGTLLGYFSYTRYKAWKLDPHNTINVYYWKATVFITAALILYGFAGLFFESPTLVLRIAAAVATILNTFGFGYFLLIPIYSWRGDAQNVIIRGAARLYAIAVAAMLVISPPQSFIDSAGIIHWRFNAIVGWSVVGIASLAFALNIILLSLYFKRLSSLSFFNLIALMFTFFLSGIGGGYLYVGDNPIFLIVASIFLFVGIFSVFWSVAQVAVKKKTSPYSARR